MRESDFVIAGKTIMLVPYDKHPPIESDSRIPNYRVTKPKIQCCLNCKFAMNDNSRSLLCCLTLNDRGYFSGIVPFGICDSYEKGKIVDVEKCINKVFRKK